MWDKLSLGGKMALMSSFIVAISLVVGISIAANQASKAVLNLALKDAESIGRTQSLEVQRQLNQPMLIAKELQKTFMAMRRSGVVDRAAYNAVLEDTMRSNPALAGAWAGFEPNAFDGRDAEFKGQKPHNETTGRYVTYFYDFGKGIQPYFLTGLDKIDENDPTTFYYTIPMKTGKPYVVDPVTYDIEGVNVLLPSFVYPVFDKDGKTIGVVGIDMAVNALASQFAKLKPMGTGRVSVLSNKKVMVATPDAKKLGKPVDKKETALLAALKKVSGDKVVIEEMGDKHHLFLPIDIMDVNTPWTIEVAIPTATLTESADAIMWNMIFIAVGMLVILIFTLLIAGNKIIKRPLTNSVAIINELKQGNFEVKITERRRQDEIGEINTALETFRDDAKKMRQMEHEQQEALVRASEERHEMRNKMADQLEETLGQTINQLKQSATLMRNDSGDMAGIAERSIDQAVLVASSAESSSANANAVASATEELSASINEISSQVQLSSSRTHEAVDESQRADEMVKRLSASAEKIGEVVNIINDIASQTNLLALNATIEAARAGEAGKGFAVVATEVKNLANQTATATEEIAQQVGTIQEETKGTVAAIGTVASTVSAVNEIAATIAAAVEEQGAATQEISSSIQQAAAGAAEVTSTISEVREGAMNTGEQAKALQGTVGGMDEAISGLDHEVRSFLDMVRNSG